MARDVVLDVIARKDSRDLDRLADQFDRVAKEMDHAGDSAKRETTALEQLDREIGTARTRVRELADEYNRTGNVDAFKSMRAAKQDLTDLEKIGKELGSTITQEAKKGESAFISLSSKFQQSASEMMGNIPMIGGAFSKMIAALPPEISIPVVVTVVGSTAALVGAGIGGAVTAALGLGGIATGVLLQLKSPEVSDALGELGNKITKVFRIDSGGFSVQVQHAIGIFNTALDEADGHIASIFSKLAPMVNPIAQGLSKMFLAITAGVDKASSKVGPVLAVLAKDLPEIGQAVGDAFEVMAKYSRGGAEGLHTILLTFAGLIRLAGGAVAEFEIVYDWLLKIGDKTTEWGSKLTAWLPPISAAWKKAHGEVKGLREGIDAAGLSTDDLRASTDGLVQSEDQLNAATKQAIELFDGLFGKEMSVDQATDSYHRALINLAESVKQNGRSLSLYSKEGLANRDALLAGVEAAKQSRQANIDNGMSLDEANQKYEDQIRQLEALGKNLGLRQKDIDDLIKKYEDIPRQISTEIDIYTYQKGSYGGIGGSGFKGFAAGGPVKAGEPILVGEEGPEIFTPSTSGTITPNDKAFGVGTAMTMSGGARPVSLNYAGAASDLEALFLSWLMKAIRTGRLVVST